MMETEIQREEIEETIICLDMESTSSLPNEAEADLKESKEKRYLNVDKSVSAKLLLLSSRSDHRNSFSPTSIYKVPEKLRKGKEDSFVPRIVSIGPHNHGRSHVQAMELFKLRCLERFRKKHEGAVDLIIKEIVEKEIQIRDCYEESFAKINGESFVEMIMLDTIFILELFWELYTDQSPGNVEEATKNARIFEQEWMMSEILHDILLLENQLPWFVISLCLRHANAKAMPGKEIPPSKAIPHLDMFFDFLGALALYFKRVGIICSPEVILTQTIYSHFVEILWVSLLPKSPWRRPRRQGKPEYTRTATELKEAGVKFTKGEGRNTTDIRFSFLKGELTIPPISVNEWTETLFPNLIALEQCRRGGKHKIITSYIILMDFLINTSNDVDLLIKSGIIEHSLSDSKEVAELFNNLHKETLIDNKEFYFAKQCEELNEYSRDYWYQWKAAWLKWKRMLGSDSYFGNPWTTISVIAATLLLALTIIQTVCSLTKP